MPESTEYDGAVALWFSVFGYGRPGIVDEEKLARLRPEVVQVLLTLSPQQKTVVCLLFGIPDGGWMSPDEVAERIGRSAERVRQIRSIALRKLRHPTRAGRLKRSVEHKLNDVSTQTSIRCQFCGVEFHPSRRWQRYCCSRCRSLDWEAMHPRKGLVPRRFPVERQPST